MARQLKSENPSMRDRHRPRRQWPRQVVDEMMPAMEITTTRFGSVAIEPDDVIFFPTGILGLDGCLHWVLLADAQSDTLGWLQSTTHCDVALAVVSPRRFVPDYQVRIARGELAPLAIEQ